MLLRNLRFLVATGLFGVAVLGLVEAARAEPGGAGKSRPNVLLIVVDTLRADHLGVYGYERPTSPVIDSLAQQATVFTRAYSTSSWTQPAIASLFTGAHPTIIEPRSARYVPLRAVVVAAAFQQAGYETAAFVANPVLHPRRGFGGGFQEYQSWILDRGGGKPQKADAKWINERALAWLDARADVAAPWFLYLHYMEPHTPYEPAQETAQRFWRHDDVDIDAARKTFRERLGAYHREEKVKWTRPEVEAMTDLYDAAIAEVDAAIGEVVGRLDEASRKNTIICITADHGEELSDHGGFLHAHALYDELIHVPLILVPGGGAGAGRRVDAIVQITDIAPTLVALAGLPGADTFRGRNLFAAAADQPARAELAPFDRTFHRKAIVHGKHKLIEPMDGAAALLFDVESDPDERRNLAAEQPALVARLRAEIERIEKRTEPLAREPPPPTVMPDAGIREQLRALGYNF